MKRNRRFKLEIELIPHTAWRLSLYNILPRSVWNEMKRQLYAEEGRKCYLCNSEKGALQAHEFWEYDDERNIQKLVAMHHLCNLCHKIKHIGFWCHTADGRAKLREEKLNRERLIQHFCEINNCTRKDFLEHEKQAFDLWKKRSKHRWKQDFGKFTKYIRSESEHSFG